MGLWIQNEFGPTSALFLSKIILQTLEWIESDVSLTVVLVVKRLISNFYNNLKSIQILKIKDNNRNHINHSVIIVSKMKLAINFKNDYRY